MADPNMSVNVNYSPLPAGYTFPAPKKDLGTVQEATAKLNRMKAHKVQDGNETLYVNKYAVIGSIMRDENETRIIRNHHKGYFWGKNYFDCRDVDGDGKFDSCQTTDSNKNFVIENQNGKYKLDRSFDDVYKQCFKDEIIHYTVGENLRNNIPDKRADAFKIE